VDETVRDDRAFISCSPRRDGVTTTGDGVDRTLAVCERVVGVG
jgi:hypothetical protein